MVKGKKSVKEEKKIETVTVTVTRGYRKFLLLNREKTIDWILQHLSCKPLDILCGQCCSSNNINVDIGHLDIRWKNEREWEKGEKGMRVVQEIKMQRYFVFDHKEERKKKEWN